MAGPIGVIDNFDEFRKVLRGFDRNLGRTIGQANKKVAQVYEKKAAPKIPTKIAGSKNLDKGLRARARQNAIVLVARSTRSRPTVAALLGANIHHIPRPGGGSRAYPMSVLRRPVWNEHLGNKWEPEDLYGIGHLFKDVPNEVGLLWFDAVREALEGYGG